MTEWAPSQSILLLKWKSGIDLCYCVVLALPTMLILYGRMGKRGSFGRPFVKGKLVCSGIFLLFWWTCTASIPCCSLWKNNFSGSSMVMVSYYPQCRWTNHKLFEGRMSTYHDKKTLCIEFSGQTGLKKPTTKGADSPLGMIPSLEVLGKTSSGKSRKSTYVHIFFKNKLFFCQEYNPTIMVLGHLQWSGSTCTVNKRLSAWCLPCSCNGGLCRSL